jgi:hypothetical protein
MSNFENAHKAIERGNEGATADSAASLSREVQGMFKHYPETKKAHKDTNLPSLTIEGADMSGTESKPSQKGSNTDQTNGLAEKKPIPEGDQSDKPIKKPGYPETLPDKGKVSKDGGPKDPENQNPGREKPKVPKDGGPKDPISGGKDGDEGKPDKGEKDDDLEDMPEKGLNDKFDDDDHDGGKDSDKFDDDDHDGGKDSDKFDDDDHDGGKDSDKFDDDDHDGGKDSDKFDDDDYDGGKDSDKFDDDDYDGGKGPDKFDDDDHDGGKGRDKFDDDDYYGGKDPDKFKRK